MPKRLTLRRNKWYNRTKVWNISLRRKVGTVMATKEQMEKVKDIVVKLRYLECMDNIIYYDRWNNCPKDGFDYEGKVGAYLTELSNEKLTSKETKELVEITGRRDSF